MKKIIAMMLAVICLALGTAMAEQSLWYLNTMVENGIGYDAAAENVYITMQLNDDGTLALNTDELGSGTGTYVIQDGIITITVGESATSCEYSENGIGIVVNDTGFIFGHRPVRTLEAGDIHDFDGYWHVVRVYTDGGVMTGAQYMNMHELTDETFTLVLENGMANVFGNVDKQFEFVNGSLQRMMNPDNPDSEAVIELCPNGALALTKYNEVFYCVK